MKIEQLRRVLSNPDGESTDDLIEASRMLVAVYGYKKAAVMLGGDFSVRGLRAVWHYIDQLIVARVNRTAGRIEAAIRAEKAAELVYKTRIPERLKW